MSISIELFGHMNIVIDGMPVKEWRSRTTRWLFAILVLNYGKTVDRSWLAGNLWPDSSEHQAHANLRFNLSLLRTTLGTERNRIRQIKNGGLEIDLQNAHFDIQLFDSLCTSQECEDLEKAIETYTAPLLISCDLDWIIEERKRKEEALFKCLLNLSQIYIQVQKWHQALPHLIRAHSIDLYNEDIADRIMHCYLEANEKAECVQFYRKFRFSLITDLNIEPRPELKELYETARYSPRHQTRPIPQSTRSMALVEKHIASSIRGLPPQSVELFGRESEQEELLSLHFSKRLITLTGGGGVGKTSLAVSVGKQLEDRYSKTVCFVELASVPEGADVLPEILSAMGYFDTDSLEIGSELPSLFYQRDLVLILDNCEHLLENCAHTIKKILSLSSSLHIIVTSRKPLGLVEEWNWKVPALTLPEETGISPERVLNSSSAVTLFTHRACMANKNFQLTNDNCEDIVQICRSIEGNPLAIEMAASRISCLSPKYIASKIVDKCIQFLELNDPTIPNRHRNLYAALDWSFNLLGENEKRVLMYLALFPAGCMLSQIALAEKLFDQKESGIETTLYELSQWCMLKYDDGNLIYRYRLHELVRQFALQKLHHSDLKRSALRLRAEVLADTARNAKHEIVHKDQGTWLDILEADYSNFAQLFQELESNDASEYVTNLDLLSETAVNLTPFWEIRGYISYGLKILLKLLNAYYDSLDLVTCTDILLSAAQLSIALGQNREASVLMNSAYSNIIKTGDRQQKGIYCYLYAQREDITAEEHVHMLDQALNIFEQLEDIIWIPRILSNMAQDNYRQFQFEQAENNINRALTYTLITGDIRTEARLLTVHGNVLGGRSERHRALSVYHANSLKIYRELKDLKGMAVCLLNVGGIQYDIGDSDNSIEAYMEAETLFRRLERRGRAAYAKDCAGCALTLKGSYLEAEVTLENCLLEARDLMDEILEAEVLADLCCLAYQSQDIDAMKKWITQINYIKSEQIIWQLYRASSMNALLELDCGNVMDAERLIVQFLEKYSSYMDSSGRVEMNLCLCLCYKMQGRIQDLGETLSALLNGDWKLCYPQLGHFHSHLYRGAQLLQGTPMVHDAICLLTASVRLRTLSEFGASHRTELMEKTLLSLLHEDYALEKREACNISSDFMMNMGIDEIISFFRKVLFQYLNRIKPEPVVTK